MYQIESECRQVVFYEVKGTVLSGGGVAPMCRTLCTLLIISNLTLCTPRALVCTLLTTWLLECGEKGRSAERVRDTSPFVINGVHRVRGMGTPYQIGHAVFNT